MKNSPGKTSSTAATPWLTNGGRFAGAIGSALLLSAPLTFWITGDMGPVLAKLILGVLLVAAYLGTNRDVLARMKGARSSGLLALSVGSTVLVLAVVAMANYLAFKYPKEFDLTRESVHTLSPQTHDLLGRLQTPVKVLAFYSPGESAYARVVGQLARYATLGDTFTFQMIDPQSHPSLAETYGITKSGARIVVVAGDADARVQELAEEELTNAIISVAEPSSAKVYFLVGHGEGNVSDGQDAEGFQVLADAIRSEGFGVDTLNLIGRSKGAAARRVELKAKPEGDLEEPAITVPQDAGVVVILSPQTALFEHEVAALGSFLEKGGRVLALLEPHVETGLEPLLLTYDIKLQDDMVVDMNPLARAMGFGAAAPVIQRAEAKHPISKDLKMVAIFVTARSLALLDEGGARAVPLMVTGESAWGETAVEDGIAELDENDHPGPLVVAAASSRALRHEHATLAKSHGAVEESRMVVFGDGDFLNNGMISQVGNKDLFLNSLNWLLGEEKRITVRPNTRAASQLMLSGEQMGRLAFFSIDILPVLLIAMGLGIVLIRRQR